MQRLATVVLLFALTAAGAAALPVVRFAGTDYVSMVDVCARLGLRFSVSPDGRFMYLRSSRHSATLSGVRSEERNLTLDGVRVYLGDPAVDRGGHFYVSQTDFDHRLLPLFRPDLAGPPPRRPRTIVLDPGHGGTDPGAENHRFRLKEKEVTLDVALRLRPLLVRDGWRVAMTRTRDTQFTTDKHVDLEMRARFASEQGADVFLSIHFDAVDRARASDVRGSEIFSYFPRGQRSTESWGRSRNDRRLEFEPGNRNDNWNTVLAHCLFRGLPRSLGTVDLGERINDWSVLRNATCPAVLVEPAYLSNDSEARRLIDPAFRQKLAEALAAGLREYVTLIESLQPRPRPAGSHPHRR